MAILDGNSGVSVTPGESKPLYKVNEDGEIVPRAGVSWQELANAGVHPSQVIGAEQVEIDAGVLEDAGVDMGDVEDVEGIEVDGDTVTGWHFPAVSAAPQWLTEDLQDRLAEGENIDIDDIDGFPTEAFYGLKEAADRAGVPIPWTHIMPGMALFEDSELVHFCTANFVFRDGDDRYIGTAGHCVTEGQTVSANLVHDGELRRIEFGETVYSTGSGGTGMDFALIRIYDEYHDLIDPRMSLVDGPCGHREEENLDRVLHYGHGLVIGTGGTPRAGVVVKPPSGEDTVWFAGAAMFGDSGSAVRFKQLTEPVEEPGAAAAALTHISIVPPGFVIGTDMNRIFELLDENGFGSVELVNSPVCE